MPKLLKTACRVSAAAMLVLLLAHAPQLAAEPGQQADYQVALATQPELVDRALAELQAPQDATPHLYFVGFAGYGPAGVFKREVVAVRELFNERFGTKGRSVALINHISTMHDVPLASPQNLDRVLQHVGRLMDRNRDTLFLFLTSHGERALLAVEMPGLQLQHLSPAMLRRMLDRSGIRNSVIVVSACHSGSFIPELASPTRLVIAAARADRTSFGCDDRREWTYFGDAYFNRALRVETSFKRAFARAKRLVAQWESSERLTPSLPQMMGGEALILNDWRRR
jgi:Peptidase C13 family